MLHKRLHAEIERRYGNIARAIAEVFPAQPDGIIITGSGQENLLSALQTPTSLRFADIPHFPVSGVAGHSGEIRSLTFQEKTFLLFSGRCHLYEGYSPEDTLSSVAVGYLLGARSAMITNAAGGLNPLFSAGDVMLIDSHVNMMFRSARRAWMYRVPLAFNNNTDYYSIAWRKKIGIKLAERSVPYREGVYVGLLGPNYETPAEIRAYRILGGDAIGMSTVLEAEFAAFCGMNVSAFSLITNTLRETKTSVVSHEEVIHAGKIGAQTMEQCLLSAMESAEI